MADDSDQTKELMEKLLAQLYGKAAGDNAKAAHLSGGSFLVAEDKQFLGRITTNPYDQESILNAYGPYGSAYSGTSIFNQFSPYGGQYGRFSPYNPYTTTPPTLVINDKVLGKVSANSYVPNHIPVEAFIYTLKNDISGLLAGRINRDQPSAHSLAGDTFLQAADGTFLGSLRPDSLDVNSLFNRYSEYGNRFSAKSIFNRYSTYGGKFSTQSHFNARSATPPSIMSQGKRVAYLTANPQLPPRVAPEDILQWAREHVSRRRA